MEEVYVYPEIEVIELYSEGVLCDSTMEDNDIVDGEW